MNKSIYVIKRFDPADGISSGSVMCYTDTEDEAREVTRKYNLESGKDIRFTAQGDVIESDENLESMAMIDCDEPIWYEYEKIDYYKP